MTEIGELFDHAESGYRLVVIGTHWALVEVGIDGEIVAQDYSSPDYAAAKQAGLMAARVYVPHFAEHSAAYIRFRDELLEATKPTDEESFKEWLRNRHQEVVNGFLQTLERDVGNYKLEDLLAFGRRQYARYLGKVV